MIHSEIKVLELVKSKISRLKIILKYFSSESTQQSI